MTRQEQELKDLGTQCYLKYIGTNLYYSEHYNIPVGKQQASKITIREAKEIININGLEHGAATLCLVACCT